MTMPPSVRASFIHLAASALVALLALAVVFGLWYPSPLQQTVGVASLYWLLIGVDLTIGPLLTLVVYKPGKKSLKFDLATIVCLQLAALSYGLWSVAEGRPVWLVFSVDRFDLVQAYELDSRNLAKAKAEFRQLSWLGPRWAAAPRPSDVDQDREALFKAVFDGVDLAQRPDLYVPLEEEADTIRKRAHPVAELARFNDPQAVEAARTRWPDADAFLPMKGRVAAVTVLLEKKSARVVAIVNLNPWAP